MSISTLPLSQDLKKALAEEGYKTATQIQEEAIPHLLRGADILASAATGTGKTAAFALPILQRLMEEKSSRRAIKALILTPTRELALQVRESFVRYGKYLPIESAAIFGGVSYFHQKRALARRPQVLVATPGRMIDLMGQGMIDLTSLAFFVLDEADRMLDMGFIDDVRRILKAIPAKRQTLLFSATLPSAIKQLATSILKDPVHIKIAPPKKHKEQINQAVYFVDQGNKKALLSYVLQNPETAKVLVFTRTKTTADRVSEYLTKTKVSSEAIHARKSQQKRQYALERFRSGKTQVLVASDIAARGLDIDDITHVINYDLPETAETYVHRIGRTGRADAVGTAFSFCGRNERHFLAQVERLTGSSIPEIKDHPFAAKFELKTAKQQPSSKKPAWFSKKKKKFRPRPRSA